LRGLGVWKWGLTTVDDSRNPFLIFFDEVLRGVSQTFFTNNPISGLLILTGIHLQSEQAFWLSFVGVVFATLAAYFLKVDRNSRRSGAYGFLGFLIGAAFPLFHAPHFYGFSRDLAAVAVLSALSSVIMNSVNSVISRTIGFSPLGTAFLSVAYSWIILGRFVVFLIPLNGSFFSPVDVPYVGLDSALVFKTTMVTVASIAFCDQVSSGILFTVAVFVSSPITAFMMVFGSLLGLSFQLLAGIRSGVIYSGLLACNSLLASMALGGFFIVLRGYRAFLFVILGSFISFLLSVVFWKYTPFGLPFLGLPFTLTVWIMLHLVRAKYIGDITLVPSNRITVPEDHFSFSGKKVKE